MTENEAVNLLRACKPLASRLISLPSSLNPTSITLSAEERSVMQGYSTLLLDPIIAGPNLLNKLVKLAELTQAEVYKLDQVKHMMASQRYGGLRVASNYQLGVGLAEKQRNS